MKVHKLTSPSVAAKLLAAIGTVVLGGYWYPESWAGKNLVAQLYANVATSLLSISLTVLLIDRLNEARERSQLKSRLLREMGSADRGIAVRAAKEIRAEGWMSDGSLQGADLTLANLEGADLTAASMENVNLSYASISSAVLTGANLAGCTLEECNAEGASLKGATLRGASLRRVAFSGAVLDDADLSGGVDLLAGSFVKSSLRSSKLPQARLDRVDFLKCDLTGCDLRDAVLVQANLAESTLDAANLERADLQEIIGWQSIRSMDGCRITGAKNLPDGFREYAVAAGAID